jgi:molecular chaperone GrpE
MTDPRSFTFSRTSINRIAGAFEESDIYFCLRNLKIRGGPNGENSMDNKAEEEKQVDNIQEELNEALDKEKKRSDELLNRLKYAQADLENLKKRCDRQIEDARKYGNERLIINLLDVVDELELAVRSGKSTNSKDVLVQGVEMTLKKLRNVLEKEGVSPIECVGQPFDPSKHDAVAKIEKDDAKECTILEEIRRGYTMREKVIRPSAVKVVVKPSSESQKETSSDE